MELKNKLAVDSNERTKKVLRERIENIYEETQRTMTIKYYENIIARLIDEKEVDKYREKFLNNKKYIGERIQQENNTVGCFEEYKPIIMNELDQRLIKINKKKQRQALVSYNNKLMRIIRKTISYLFN